MNTKALFFLLLLLSSSVFGQGNKFTVSGIVTDCQTKSALIDFPIKLVCSNGNALETKTDVNGKYSIELQNIKLPLSCVLSFYVEKNPISCIYTGEKTKFTIDEGSTKSRIENRCLVNMGKAEKIVFPELFYKYNSIESIKTKTDPIALLSKIMLDNPKFVIGVDAHVVLVDKGCNDSIQNLRSEYIKKKLIEKGIEADRIQFQTHRDNSCGKNPTEAELKAVKTKADRIAAWGKIYHIQFAILRKDYISPNATKQK